LDNALVSFVLLVVFGFLSGAVGGMLGLGGGAVTIPAMVLLLGIDQHLAQGVSLAAIIFTSAAGTIVHYRQGTVSVPAVLWIVPAAVLFAIISSVLASRLPGADLRKIFAVVVFFIGIRMIYTGLRAETRSIEAVEGR
jgi:uncharacterized membrane protein YfcA